MYSTAAGLSTMFLLSLQASAVRPELLLLSSSLDMEDCCWEQRMRTGERVMVNGCEDKGEV